MRQSRRAQLSILDFYAKHEHAQQLSALSDLLNNYPIILTLISRYFAKRETASTGACGLSMETIFRCLLLKKILRVSYRKLAFHLSDSPSYRAESFARLRWDEMPSKSVLQHTVRQVTPQTLKLINQQLMLDWIDEKKLSIDSLRIDSTVVKSNIPDPMDSQMLNDGVRVLSRMMYKESLYNGHQDTFSDQRENSNSLSFQKNLREKSYKRRTLPKFADVCIDNVKATGKSNNQNSLGNNNS